MSDQMDYATYLRIDDLLTLQQPLSDEAHDEMLFIVAHQSYELNFKIILHELDNAMATLRAGELSSASASLRRVVMAEDILTQTVRLIETISPDGFLRFRDPLTPASGFQSMQFRAIEYASGGGNLDRLDDRTWTDDQRRWLKERAAAPTLWDAYVTACRDAGVVRVEATGDELTAGFVELYRDHREPTRALLHAIGELLVDHDEGLSRWRYHHALMAAREIGRRPGTGGSTGVAYLESTLAQRLYPQLWEVRSRL
jgi:tryptophan 2,3-dioxygenase